MKNFPVPEIFKPQSSSSENFRGNELLDYLITVSEFKKNNYEEKRDNEKQDKSVSIINSSNDINLIEALKNPSYPDKEYQIVNSFFSLDKENESTDEEILKKIANEKMMKNENFSPGIFSDFDFGDKIKDLLSSVLDLSNINSKRSAVWLKKETGGESAKTLTDMSDEAIIDLCLSQKLYFKKGKKQNEVISKRSSSDLKEIDKNEEEKLQKFAILEYENQVLSYQTLNDIDARERFEWVPKEDEALNEENHKFFHDIVDEVKDKYLKNKVRLILKAIDYIDPITKKPLVTNEIKNKIYAYWKKEYFESLNKLYESLKEKEKEEKAEIMKPIQEMCSSAIDEIFEQKEQSKNTTSRSRSKNKGVLVKKALTKRSTRRKSIDETFHRKYFEEMNLNLNLKNVKKHKFISENRLIVTKKPTVTFK